MADKCVVRNKTCKRGGLNTTERHNERKNEDYHNGDIIRERSAYNVHYKQSEGSYEQTFDKMLADGAISTRGLPSDPHIVDELVFDVNTAYFERHGGYEYARTFYEEAYRLAADVIGGEQYVLSAVMHADERNKALSEELGRDVYHYHLHVVYVPVVQKEIYFRKNNKNPELAGKLREVITQVSHSKKWPRYKTEKGWVNSYSLLQDRFFDHMRASGYTDVDRGERGSTAEHLSVLEYKTQQETERAAAIAAVVNQQQEIAASLDTTILNQRLAAANLDKEAEEKKKKLAGLEKKTATATQEAATFADIDRMSSKRTIIGDVAISQADWKTVSGLAKKGVKSQGIISGLESKNDALLRKIGGLEKRLEGYVGKSMTDTMRYHQAMQRPPRRMAETVSDVLRQPPEKPERENAAPERKRSPGLE